MRHRKGKLFEACSGAIRERMCAALSEEYEQSVSATAGARKVPFSFYCLFGSQRVDGSFASYDAHGFGKGPLRCTAPALAGAPKPPAAYVAELVPTPGHAQVSGSIRFESALNKSGQEVVFVSPSVNGLAPGPHGLNVHDVAGDGSVGASFNPDGRPHGSPSSIKKFGASACHFVGEGCQWNRHAGDLGNLVADADGNAQGVEKKFKDLYVSLNPKKPECVAGKAVVVRARADDFKTEADDGDAGEIVAVGVIKAAAAA